MPLLGTTTPPTFPLPTTNSSPPQPPTDPRQHTDYPARPTVPESDVQFWRVCRALSTPCLAPAVTAACRVEPCLRTSRGLKKMIRPHPARPGGAMFRETLLHTGKLPGDEW